MKRIIIWGLFLFSIFTLNVSAKDRYLVKVEIVGEHEKLKVNFGFKKDGVDTSNYWSFEDGFYLLNNHDNMLYSNQGEYIFEIPENLSNATYQVVVDNDDGRYKTDGFYCHFIKDENDDNVCYQEYNYVGGLLKNVTNINILISALNRVKDNVIPMVVTTVILILIAILFNLVMRRRGASKNIINIDIFYIVFNIAIIIFSFVLYLANLFNARSMLVLISIVFGIYYFLYYLSKAGSSKEAGGVRYLCALISYLLALLSSVLIFSYFL